MTKSFIRRTSIFVLFLLTVMTSIAQKRITVHGKVTDQETGESLSGVSVSVINTAGLGTFSNKEGIFSLKVEVYHKLLFSYIGYDTVQVQIKENDTVNVSMKKSNIQAMDEVVVTALGTQKDSMSQVPLQLWIWMSSENLHPPRVL
ncbi:carboxypeptidase-like regulatory domain-containing protein [Arachidicoccus ginsenosidivorans]|uniref:carboxypeptidase-like regulatory domain-containing protein n=1 Tax=Arachidicoccus ginsenosidivorans TaxID=496057 RepID=UPI001CEF9EA5|nr:carboxypeptidase-like regulatory domain-containing protein [Arachidicoccus ginsenosidivorans]